MRRRSGAPLVRKRSRARVPGPLRGVAVAIFLVLGRLSGDNGRWSDVAVVLASPDFDDEEGPGYALALVGGLLILSLTLVRSIAESPLNPWQIWVWPLVSFMPRFFLLGGALWAVKSLVAQRGFRAAKGGFWVPDEIISLVLTLFLSGMDLWGVW